MTLYDLAAVMIPLQCASDLDVGCFLSIHRPRSQTTNQCQATFAQALRFRVSFALALPMNGTHSVSATAEDLSSAEVRAFEALHDTS